MGSTATDDVRQRLSFARDVAVAAGAEVMAHYGATEHELKEAGSPVTAADLAANRRIVESLRERFPEDAILSEESRDSGARLEAERVWVVDPLDGTKEFLAQNGEFSVMIGQVERGHPTLGVVAVPAVGRVYWAADGLGCWVEEAGVRRRLRVAPARADRLRMVGSRSHPNALLLRMQEALGIEDVRPSGSVGVKCSLIVEGQRDLYIHPVPYLNEWDTCAPEVLVREAGGQVTDCLGNALRYNKPDPVQPDGIVASGVDVADAVLACIVPLYRQAAALQ